jgi:hypothetical protein
MDHNSPKHPFSNLINHTTGLHLQSPSFPPTPTSGWFEGQSGQCGTFRRAKNYVTMILQASTSTSTRHPHRDNLPSKWQTRIQYSSPPPLHRKNVEVHFLTIRADTGSPRHLPNSPAVDPSATSSRCRTIPHKPPSRLSPSIQIQ